MRSSQTGQTKLLADARSTVATSRVTVGIAMPLAGHLYDANNFRTLVASEVLLFGTLAWLPIAVGLNPGTRRVLGNLDR